ncbi:Hypothetical predicted protein [Paramuricea clavata]|uniref:Uncharacterized protein n=1 Tax=Paramuricea clavata TaxID=317549 RepID=A0A6S7FS03_PARCT|nr:Hypothetical predicted protein [Paramuricea clavata]
MWLVRLARVLKLKSVTQKSFTEYHSKRNLVERVHAVENRALSNEVFSSTAVRKDYIIEDQHHRENMEHMAGEVQNCLARTQYVLEMTYKVFAHGIDTVLLYIAFLSWYTEDEVKQFYAEFKDRLDTKFQNDKELEYWCQHELYKNKDKTSLKLKCRANKISGDGKKHELVKRPVEKLEKHVLPPVEKYDGQMS